MSLISNGIAEIQVDGDVLGFTEEDSFTIITDDNTSVQSFNVEEQDDPIYSTQTGSKSMSLEFTIADPDYKAVNKLFGVSGSSSSVTVPGVSNILKGVPVKVKSKMGWGFDITSADVSSRFTDAMGKNSLLGLVVTVTLNAGFTLTNYTT